MTTSFSESLPKMRQDAKALVTCIPSSVDEVEVVDSPKFFYRLLLLLH